MNLKKIGKVFTSKFVGTGPSSFEKRIYQAAVSQSWETALRDHVTRESREWPQKFLSYWTVDTEDAVHKSFNFSKIHSLVYTLCFL